ncbi:hypothetical protein [Egicoccus sp. AB-alg6-2]|uniref:hypothetical protein n=1 Tax=Egicoccus sp. AB-alg6-2 TaxID=3242692 RepID=UPI00359D2CC6
MDDAQRDGREPPGRPNIAAGSTAVAGRVGLTLVLVAGIAAVLAAGALLDAYWRMAGLELLLVAVLALVPGWLYLEFVVHRGQGLYDEYVLNLFRIHADEYRNLPAPPQHTSYYQPWRSEHDALQTTTTDNLYRRKFEAVFGPASVSTRALIGASDGWRELGRTFGPVALATIVLCVGWALTLQPELLRDVADGGPMFAGRSQIATSALQFGFVGAYVFILQDLVRRYFRDDLKPAAYVSAVVRVIVVAMTVTAVHQVWQFSDETEAVFAFFIGFFPQTGLRLLLTSLTRPVARLIPSFAEEHPLHEIDGLSIWYEARLLEEGIEDIQNLTTGNLIDVMLRTRVPLNRLIDWLDQGFLYLRLADDEGKARRQKLRRLGIRTASDLEAVWSRGAERPALRAAVGEALGEPGRRGESAVEGILATLQGESNYWHVQQYRQHEWLLRDQVRHALAATAAASVAAGSSAGPPSGGARQVARRRGSAAPALTIDVGTGTAPEARR